LSFSIVNNADKYLKRLHRTLCDNGLIEDPKDVRKLVRVQYDHNKKIIGWEIRCKEIKFNYLDYLDCDEYASKGVQGQHIIKEFSYHFKPTKEEGGLLSFRVDIQKGDLHFNPDPILESKLEHRIPADKMPMNIEDFNVLLAIHMVNTYISSKVYPTDDKTGTYDKVLEPLRELIR
jgi:hypothetical protein